MICLTSLPVELGQQIWSYLVLPDDIESYSLVCWQIHRLGTKVIIGHRQLRKQFTSVGNSISTLPQEPKGTSYLELFQLLELVTANPIHALYVKNLIINRWHHDFETEEAYKTRINGHRLRSRLTRDEGPWFQPYAKDTFRLLEQAIEDSKFLDSYVKQAWINGAKRGHEGPVLVILLTLLSKLQNLTIHRVGGEFSAVFYHIHVMLKAPTLEMLPALKSVELSRTLEIGYFDAKRAFSSTSHVKHLRLRSSIQGQAVTGSSR